MKDAFATLGIFTGILLIIALGLYLLSRWHARIERRLRAWPAGDSFLASAPKGYPTISTRHTDSNWGLLRHLRRYPQYPTISHADLDVEAANAEAGYFSLQEHILHVNKFRGRHHDAA